jgi:hypothetical protein
VLNGGLSHEADLSTYFCNVRFRALRCPPFAAGIGAKPTLLAVSGTSAFALLRGKRTLILHAARRL